MRLNIKNIIYTSTAILIIITYTSNIYGENRIGVVKSRFDNIEIVFDTYRINYDLLQMKDLENSEVFEKYDSIFFPSGILSDYEDNIDVSWQGKNHLSVKLSKNFFELNPDIFKKNLRRFTKNGGASYFSGYAFKQLAMAYDDFEFFDDFPYMGIQSRIEADIKGDLARYILKRKTGLHMDYPGWVTLKHVNGAEILAESSFPTPRGEKFGPLSVLIHDGGEILYTSYYSSVYNDFKRFNIYRIAGNHLRKKALNKVKSHFQKPTGLIIDAFLKDETSRQYYLNLASGYNTIYFISDSPSYMFEIYDRDMSLIISKDYKEAEQSYTLKSSKDDYCFVKVYPPGTERFAMYSIISAHGYIIPPVVTLSIKILAAIIGAIFLAALIQVVISRLR
ncbi:MAG: hypothetical protein FWF73_00960 [Spirochaetes bacterium]|nr:hypothetical protein [Spirochaetota bacterium]